MAFRINTNIPAIKAQNSLGKNQNDMEKALVRLASGNRITEASDDAAGLAISESLKAQVHGSKAAQKNTSEAKAFVQAAEGALNEQNNILLRMRELAIQSASDTVSDLERGFIDFEFQEIHQELDRLAHVTTYRGHALLVGEGQSFTIQAGANSGPENTIEMNIDIDATQTGFGTDGLEISDQDYAVESLEALDNAILQVNGFRAKLGAYQSRLEKAENHIAHHVGSLTEAHSRIADTDFAQETATLASAQLKNEAAISVLAQANGLNGRAVRLIDRI